MVGVIVPPYSMLSGLIMQWSGAIANIPYGWIICDGNNGTPNLTDRFVIHADADAAGTRNVSDVGGAHTHVLATGEMPSHAHNLEWHGTAGSYPTNNMMIGVCDLPANASITETNCITDEGGGAAHQNMPKFYALAYIMKT